MPLSEMMDYIEILNRRKTEMPPEIDIEREEAIKQSDVKMAGTIFN